MNTKLLCEIVSKTDKDSALALVPAEILEKFAELIVKECCDVLYDNEIGGYQVNHVLKEHFGVE